MKTKEKFLREKLHCNIGTIGHVDHGKTTLTAAITKVLSTRNTSTVFTKYSDIDKHVEERRRGITISASHIEYQTKYRHYTHIDCPGHQNYIKNMITGATQMEGVILVVALTEGPQEQTREHVILAKEVGIPYMVVYGNKLDALPELDMKEFVELETRELVANYGFPSDLPFIAGSARKALEEPLDAETSIGTGSVEELMNTVDEYIKQPSRLDDAPFLMSIEEIYSISGRGTVVTGKVERGKISVGAEVEVVGPKVFKTTCTGLEMYNKYLDIAIAGENVGALLRGVAKKDV
jgi:elongation factor Tu